MSGEKGFVMIPTAPSAELRSSIEAFMVPVRKITGIFAQLPVFSLSRASNPSISGISMSNNIKSGLIFPKRANIFAADGTVITLKWSSKASSAVARFVSLSSTTKMVFK